MRFTISVLIWVLLLATSLGAAEEQTTDTTPQFWVDAEIVGEPGKERLIAARLYYDTLQASFHHKVDRKEISRSKREQRVFVLQSEAKQFGCAALEFATVEGKKLTLDEVRERLKKPQAILMIPAGATLHADIKATLSPEAIVAGSLSLASPQKLITRPAPR